MAQLRNFQKNPRGGVYRYRLAVPPELREEIGRTQLARSYETTDRREAERRHMLVSPWVDRYLRSYREGEPEPWIWSALTEYRGDWSQHSLSRHMDQVERANEPDLEQISRRFVADVAGTIPVGCDLSTWIGDRLEQWLAGQSVRLKPKQRERLGQRVIYDLAVASLRPGDPIRLIDGMALDAVRPEPVISAQPKPVIPADPDAKRLGDLLTIYKEQRKLDRRTVNAADRAVRRFIDLHGDLPIQQYTRAQVWEFVEAQQAQGLSGATVLKALKQLRTIFQIGIVRDWLIKNPTEGVTVEVDARERHNYTGEQLTAILTSAAFQEPRANWDYRQWVTLVLIHTGARPTEICQLEVADLRQDRGIWYFWIRNWTEGQADTGKKVKTKGSERRVPVHPNLIALGLLDHWKRQKAAGAVNLWGLNWTESGGWYRSYGDWRSNYWQDELGYAKRQLTDAHAFRHTLKTFARETVDGHMIDTLTGHSPKSEGEKYGTFRLSRLAEAMASIDFGDDVNAALSRLTNRLAA